MAQRGPTTQCTRGPEAELVTGCRWHIMYPPENTATSQHRLHWPAVGESPISLPQSEPLNQKTEVCCQCALLFMDAPDHMRVHVPLPSTVHLPPPKTHIPAQPPHTQAISTVDGQPKEDLVRWGPILVWDPETPRPDMPLPLVLSFCIYEMGTVNLHSYPPGL